MIGSFLPTATKARPDRDLPPAPPGRLNVARTTIQRVDPTYQTIGERELTTAMRQQTTRRGTDARRRTEPPDWKN